MMPSVIARLRGTANILSPCTIIIDVHGVGYRVFVPETVTGGVRNNQEITLWTSTFVREDRLELYGFLENESRLLFERLIEQPGVGPRIALELCSVPRMFLLQAITASDARLLTSIRGIGKKKAEKILLDLRSLLEKESSIFTAAHSSNDAGKQRESGIDRDALAALEQLGFGTSAALQALQRLPPDLHSTEERVATALRSL